MSSKNYDDILNTDYPFVLNHARMSIRSRAAQFSAFKALSGYETEINEAARWTDAKLELDEDSRDDLDVKLQLLQAVISERPLVQIVYFIPDTKKDGGTYTTILENIKKIDETSKSIVTVSGLRIPISNIYKLEGAIFDQADPSSPHYAL